MRSWPSAERGRAMASETERITHEVCDRHEMPTQDYPHAHILWSARAKRKIDWRLVRLVCELAVIAAASLIVAGWLKGWWD